MTMIYMLFSVKTYCPAGGMNDCVGMYHTKKEANEALKRFVAKGGGAYGTVYICQLNTTTLEYANIDEETDVEEQQCDVYDEAQCNLISTTMARYNLSDADWDAMTQEEQKRLMLLTQRWRRRTCNVT